MELELTLPEDWTVEPLAPGRVVTVPGFAFVPDLVLEVHPLLRRRDVRPEQLISSRVPKGGRVVGAGASELRSRTGWRITLLRAEVRDAGGRLVETRVLATYALLVYVGVVQVRAASAERLAAMDAAIVDVLRTARPRFRSRTPAHLGDLWDMDAGPAS